MLLATLGIFFIPIASSNEAESLNQESQKATQKQLQHLQQKIRSIQKLLDSNKKRHSNAQKQLAKTEKQISKTSKALRKTRQELKDSNLRLAQHSRKQKSLNKEKTKQQELLASQIRSAFMNGQQEYLRLLLNQKDPAIVGRTLEFYRYLNNARVASIQNFIATLEALKVVEKEMSKEIATLNQLEAQQSKRRKTLTRQKTQRKKIVTQLLSEIKNNDQALTGLRENEREVMAILNAIASSSNSTGQNALKGLTELKGSLKWPVRGTLKNYFGKTREQGNLKWKGVMINAPEGGDVRAIYHGRVMFADWLRGFGLLTVVDHGNGYLSLYGHNQSLFKEAGEWVESGDIISTVGQSGGSSQSGLYFEIRKGAKPLNPSHWCGSQG
ncbi:MAG: peptidoglycan DD-metalloendopeptidase family protein [Pseudomonadota bacterium]